METADAIVQSIKSHRWDGKGDGPVGLAGEELIR
jgi:hypothetical protein